MFWEAFETSWNSIISKFDNFPSSDKALFLKMIRTQSAIAPWFPIFPMYILNPFLLSFRVSWKSRVTNKKLPFCTARSSCFVQENIAHAEKLQRLCFLFKDFLYD
jgi:hypothetical protein